MIKVTHSVTPNYALSVKQNNMGRFTMDYMQDNNKEHNEDLVFFIRVQYRCNTSWQGTIQWMDGRKTSIFRSALELGNLINDARQEAASSGSKQKMNIKWQDKESVS